MESGRRQRSLCHRRWIRAGRRGGRDHAGVPPVARLAVRRAEAGRPGGGGRAAGSAGWAAGSWRPRPAPAPGRDASRATPCLAPPRRSGFWSSSRRCVAAGRGAPGAPYAAAELVRLGAMFGVAPAPALRGARRRRTRGGSARRFTPAPVWWRCSASASTSASCRCRSRRSAFPARRSATGTSPPRRWRWRSRSASVCSASADDGPGPVAGTSAADRALSGAGDRLPGGGARARRLAGRRARHRGLLRAPPPAALARDRRRRGGGRGAGRRRRRRFPAAGPPTTRATSNGSSRPRAWSTTPSIRARRSRAPGSRSGAGPWRSTVRSRSRGSAPGTSPSFSRATPSRTRPRTACCRRRRSPGAPTMICWSGSPRRGRSVWRRCWRSTPRWAPPRFVGSAARGGRATPATATAAAACAGSLAAFVGCGLTGFPFAMPATIFLFGVAVGLLAVERVARDRRAGEAAAAVPGLRARRLVLSPIAVGLAVIVGAFVTGWSARRLEASYFLARVDAALRAGDTPADAERALPFLARAERATPGDFQVALRASAAELHAGHPPAASRRAPGARSTSSPIRRTPGRRWPVRVSPPTTPPGAAAAADRALGILHGYPGALATRAQAAARLGDAATRRRRPRPPERAGRHRRRRPPPADPARRCPRVTCLRPWRRESRSSTTGSSRCAAPSACSNRSAASTRARPSSRSATSRAPSPPRSPRKTCAPPSPIRSPDTCRSARAGFRMLLPLFPRAIESLPLAEFDLIISSSHAVAKGAVAAPGALHVSYVHSPMRYIWEAAERLRAGRPRRAPRPRRFRGALTSPAPVGRRLDGAGRTRWRPTASTRRRASAGSTAVTPR